jgi:crotonyl-CoA reductase
MIEYDNRHLWMKLKTIKGSHFANYREAWDANQLVCEGKIGVLCLAPEEGLGIDDHELRARVGEDRITLFRRHGA